MAENWTKLAEAIGLKRQYDYMQDDHFWLDDKRVVNEERLPAYLMEPAQTARIMAAVGGTLTITGHNGEWWASVGSISAKGSTYSEAVARCAAECLA